MKSSISQESGGEYICTSCGHVGDSETITKGSFLIEIILWLFFLIPGLIYTIWRLTSKHSACSVCGNQTMIPVNTPRGRELVKSLGIKTLKNGGHVGEGRSTNKRKFSGLLLILFIIFFIVWVTLTT